MKNRMLTRYQRKQHSKPQTGLNILYHKFSCLARLNFKGEEKNMTNELQIIKSAQFGEVQCDVYSNNEEMFMTAKQLCECLGEKRSTFDSRISRNSYLKSEEFSVSCKLQGTELLI